MDATAGDRVTCHLNPSCSAIPGNRFTPRDEGERARYAGYALALRAAEAVTQPDYATALLDGQGQQRAVVVLGDLNDEPLAATTRILLEPPGSEIDTPGFDRAELGDGQRLWNVAPRILPEDRRPGLPTCPPSRWTRANSATRPRPTMPR